MITITGRKLNIPREDLVVGYTGDNLVEVRVIELARYYDHLNMAEFDFKLDTQIGEVKNIIDLIKTVADDKIILTWVIEQGHILTPGRMSIQIRAFAGESVKWHSEQSYVLVQPSINGPEGYTSPLPSEFEQMEQRVTAMKNQAQEAAQTAEQQADRAQGIADTFENTTLPAAIQSVEQAVEEQIGIAKGHADRAQDIADTFSDVTLPAAISAVENAGQAKVDLAEAQAIIATTKAQEASDSAAAALASEQATKTSEDNAAGHAGTATEQADRAQDIADTFENETLPAAITAVEAAGQAKVDLAEQQANIAAGHAQTAATKAEETSGYVNDAFEYKEAAEGAASIATEKAWEAANSAQIAEQQAGIAATKATEAYDSAERAKMSEEAVEGVADEHRLKIAKLEKELNDYKATMQQINVNQEATQQVTGYGVISLPKNAANGQVSVTLKGRSLKNELDYNIDTYSGWKGSLNAIIDSNGITLNRHPSYAQINTKIKPSTRYGVLGFISHNTLTRNLVTLSYVTSAVIAPAGYLGNFKSSFNSKAEISNNIFGIITSSAEVSEGASVNVRELRIFELPTGSEIEADFETLTADELAQKYPYISGDSVKSTVSAMRIRIVSEDEAEGSTAYVLAKDEDGNIEELRSLPNGTKDEINLTTGVKTQNVSEDTLVSDTVYASLDTSTYTNVDVIKTTAFSLAKAGTTGADGQTHYYNKDGVELTEVAQADIDLEASAGKYYWGEDKKLYIIVAKGTYADIASAKTGLGTTSLNYQLATPIEIPIQTSGSLVSYPSGTVYIEPFVADAGIYTDKIEVLYSDLPIKALEKLSKIDFMTGLETELDVSDAVIAEDKLSFTHPDLVEGDIVFFVYEHGAEGTIPETEISYYDSRYVIKGEDDKFYQWEIEAKLVEGVITPSIKLVEV